MLDAWELAPDFERTANQITTFILFCEDSVNEPAYFRSFQKEKKVKVNVIDNQKHAHHNLVNAVLYLTEKGLMILDGQYYKLNTDVTTHIWCIYDRDYESENRALILPKDDINFTLAIQNAERTGLNVAWSNDVFELWILLHFEEVPIGIWQHRRFVYDRLTSIFKSLPNQSPEMSIITGNQRFDYKEAMKSRGNFLLHVHPLLTSRLDYAIKNARILENSFPNTTPYHNCNPCTMVHRLVQSIKSFH